MKKLLIISLLFLFVTGCTKSVQTKNTTEITSSNDGTRTETIETTTETENKKIESKSCHGILSCTVDFLGDVISFPFRLVGGIAEAIF